MTCSRYVKFDTFHPAVDKGLPVTRVVSRVALQGILADACMRVAGSSVICNDCHVVDYEEKARVQCMQVPLLSISGAYHGVSVGHAVMQVDASGQKRVHAILEDGKRFEGDILVGADGIWSKVCG